MDLITIDKKICRRDGICREVCPYALFEADPEGYPVLRPGGAELCIACGHCVAVCPHAALDHAGVPLAAAIPVDPALAIPASAGLQFLKGRRSIREFTATPVTRELAGTLVDTTRWAPTAANRQPVRWLVVLDPVEVRRLAGITVDWLRQESTRFPQYSVFVEAWDQGQDRFLRGAPHLAVTYADEEWAWSAGDCAIALTYFELAAHAHGLGTCWAGILTRAAANSQALAEALALPAGHRVFGAVMFGHPRYRYPRIPSRHEAHVQWR